VAIEFHQEANVSKWQKHFVVAAAVIAAAALLAAISAGPAIAQIRAALVSDINNPARQPVDLWFQQQIPIGLKKVKYEQTILYTVPAGKRLVIEFLYTQAWAPPGQGMEVETLGFLVPFEQRYATYPNPDIFCYTSFIPVRTYLDPGRDVTVVLSRNATTGNAFLTIRIIGHLVDLQ
jgi:hypothetical protein